MSLVIPASVSEKKHIDIVNGIFIGPSDDEGETCKLLSFDIFYSLVRSRLSNPHKKKIP